MLTALVNSLTARGLSTRAIVVLSLGVALFCAVLSVARISLLPPSIEPRHLEVGAAATHVLVDAEDSFVVDTGQSLGDLGLRAQQRAEVYANLLVSTPVVRLIARSMGVRPGEFGTFIRLSAGVPDVLREPDNEQRATAIRHGRRRYQLDVQSDSSQPVLHIYTKAPTAAAAVRFADAAVAALRDHLLARRAATEAHNTPPELRLRFTQLGRARGGVVNGRAAPVMAVMTFVIVFAACAALLLLGRSIRRGWVASGSQGSDRPAAAVPQDDRPPPDAAAAGGDWPHTTRVLPWMIAGFMVIVWLLPFNSIELNVSLPVDMQLDRIVLPFLVLAWGLAALVGGSQSPRIRFTGIHMAVCGLVLVTCLSVVLNAGTLNQALELTMAAKKLILIVLYLVVFVIVASVIRPSEVPAFLKYTLALAVLCGMGTVWEYRFQYNVFYDVASTLLSGPFTVDSVASGTIDQTGRALTLGPGQHPLEAVAMVSLALAIALTELLRAEVRWKRILYGVAACVLFAAAISTDRKSSLLAPASVCLTIAYFRRSEMLRLAPLAAVLLALVHFLAPGALGSVAAQLNPSALGVGTVSDRASDYDAVRPDVWIHLAFGRGYGTYDYVSYRLLDSEMLGRLVDTGVIGVIAVTLMIAAIVGCARRLMRGRDPASTQVALPVAAAAVAYFVLGFLFDISSFPHAPYILMFLAGMLAVRDAARADGDTREAEPSRRAPRPVDMRANPVQHAAESVLRGSVRAR